MFSTDYLFAGESYDNELGLHDLRARLYVVSAGRLSVADSFEGVRKDPSTLNKYVYAGNDPVSNIDPSGKLFGLSVAQATFALGTLGNLYGHNSYLQRMSASGESYSLKDHAAYVLLGGAVSVSAGLLLAELVGYGAAIAGYGLTMVAPRVAPNLDRVRFAQTTARETFTTVDERSSFKFAGSSLDEVAAGLRNGSILPAEVPVGYVSRNGQALINNTRSLIANIRGGVPSHRIHWQDLTGDIVVEARVSERLQRNNLTDLGSVVIRVRPSNINVDLQEALR